MKDKGKEIKPKDIISRDHSSANLSRQVDLSTFRFREKNRRRKFSFQENFIFLRLKNRVGSPLFIPAFSLILFLLFWLASCEKGIKTKSADSATRTRAQEVSTNRPSEAFFGGQAQFSGHQHNFQESKKNAAPSSSPALFINQETSSTEEKGAAKQEKKLYYCPMHPSYISDRPGECPICGMTLVPVEKEEESENLPAGSIEISPERQQLLGITFGRVERRELHRIITAYGRLTYDETRLTSISIKFSGWIEKLYVDYTGKLVRRGEPLFSIYSPELIAAQEEYLLALKAQRMFETRENDFDPGDSRDIQDKKTDRSGSGQTGLRANWSYKRGSVSFNLADLVGAAKRRLLLLDVNEAQLDRIEKEGKPFRSLTIYSPVTGFIIEKNVVEGKFVQAGENLFSLANLSRLWLLADIYEIDLPLIEVGREVEVEFTPFPGESFRGRINYIFPYLENESRTVKVRVEFPNPEFKLKPEMYGRVKIHLRLGRRLSIPEEAVIDTGERILAFVVHGGSHFEPREIKLGIRAGEFYEVLNGLEEGEQVVTSAQFLIDSESRLKAVLKRFYQHSTEKKPEIREKRTQPPAAKHIHQ